MASTDSQKQEAFKPVEGSQNADEAPESHGTREDLTADTDVKAPGIVHRITEEVEAIVAEVWAAITPSSKK